MSKELRDLAKKVMEKVEEAVDREDEAFKRALGYIREEIKAILGNEGDDSVGEAQSPNPTVAAPIWAHMGGPQPAQATSPNAPTRTLGDDSPDYSTQMPGNGVPDLADGQEPSASIPNAQAPIEAHTVEAIGNYGAAKTSGLGTEMAHVADSDAKPEESATTIAPEDAPKAPEAPIVAGNESAVPDSGADASDANGGSDASKAPLPSEVAIQGADAGTAVSEQKEAEYAGTPEAGPLAVADEKEAEDEESDANGESDESDESDQNEDASEDSDDSSETAGDTENKPKKRGRPKKKA